MQEVLLIYKSDPLSLSTGVAQGSILGPLLFSMYINGRPSVCGKCDIIMYAADTAIFVHGKTAEDVVINQTDAMLRVTNAVYGSVFQK